MIDTLQVPEFIDGIKSENLTFYNYHFKSKHSDLNSQLILSENAVVFCINGSIKLRCSDMNKLNIVDSNSVCLLKSGALIRPQCSEGEKKDFRAIFIFFTDETLLEMTRKLKLEVSEGISKRQYFTKKNDSYIQGLTEGLKFVSSSPSSQIKLLMKLKLEELFIYLNLSQKKLSFDLFINSCVNNVSQLRRIVESHKYEKRSLSELASLCCMSLSTFKRKFVEAYGVSPSKWFSDKRLDYAASLISLNPNKKFKDLYLICGYTNKASFKNAFYRRFNEFPVF